MSTIRIGCNISTLYISDLNEYFTLVSLSLDNGMLRSSVSNKLFAHLYASMPPSYLTITEAVDLYYNGKLDQLITKILVYYQQRQELLHEMENRVSFFDVFVTNYNDIWESYREQVKDHQLLRLEQLHQEEEVITQRCESLYDDDSLYTRTGSAIHESLQKYVDKLLATLDLPEMDSIYDRTDKKTVLADAAQKLQQSSSQLAKSYDIHENG